MLKKGKYVGSDQRLRGKTALVMTVGEKSPMGIVPEGKVMIQADDDARYGFGWHEFPAEDWEVTVS